MLLMKYLLAIFFLAWINVSTLLASNEVNLNICGVFKRVKCVFFRRALKQYVASDNSCWFVCYVRVLPAILDNGLFILYLKRSSLPVLCRMLHSNNFFPCASAHFSPPFLNYATAIFLFESEFRGGLCVICSIWGDRFCCWCWSHRIASDANIHMGCLFGCVQG